MGLDPTSPQMTLLLVMLHTGTMFAVIAHYLRSWKTTYFSSLQAFRSNAINLVIATALTGVVGLLLLQLLKRLVGHNSPSFEVEHLFANAPLMAAALACAGILIIASSRFSERVDGELSPRRAAFVGVVQGLCLPFRGFSRSGATISTALAMGVSRRRAEEFSFALAVILTPPIIIREVLRLATASAELTPGTLIQAMGPGVLGMVLSFLAGLLALRWLSRWLEQDRWHIFGGYCLVAAAAVLWIG